MKAILLTRNQDMAPSKQEGKTKSRREENQQRDIGYRPRKDPTTFSTQVFFHGEKVATVSVQKPPTYPAKLRKPFYGTQEGKRFDI